MELNAQLEKDCSCIVCFSGSRHSRESKKEATPTHHEDQPRHHHGHLELLPTSGRSSTPLPTNCPPLQLGSSPFLSCQASSAPCVPSQAKLLDAVLHVPVGLASTYRHLGRTPLSFRRMCHSSGWCCCLVFCRTGRRISR